MFTYQLFSNAPVSILGKNRSPVSHAGHERIGWSDTDIWCHYSPMVGIISPIFSVCPPSIASKRQCSAIIMQPYKLVSCRKPMVPQNWVWSTVGRTPFDKTILGPHVHNCHRQPFVAATHTSVVNTLLSHNLMGQTMNLSTLNQFIRTKSWVCWSLHNIRIDRVGSPEVRSCALYANTEADMLQSPSETVMISYLWSLWLEKTNWDFLIWAVSNQNSYIVMIL